MPIIAILNQKGGVAKTTTAVNLAAVLADYCAAAGDRAGLRHWRRAMLRHQAVAWAALHPEPLEAIYHD